MWRVGEPQWGPSGIPVASRNNFDTSIFQKITKTHKSSQNGSPWLENQHLRDQASFFPAGAHGGRRFGQNHRFFL